MGFEEKFLGQLRPSGTSPVVFLTATKKTIIKTVFVTVLNTTINRFSRFSIYYSPAGTFFIDDTAIYANVAVPGPVGNEQNSTKQINTYIVVEPGASIGVQNNSGGGTITFSMFGAEID